MQIIEPKIYTLKPDIIDICTILLDKSADTCYNVYKLIEVYMSILIDGPNATDIENLETHMSMDTTPTPFTPATGATLTIRGSFAIPSCRSMRPYNGVDPHKDKLTIIVYLEDTKERWCLTGCHITSQTIDKHGSSFKFTAEEMEKEL